MVSKDLHTEIENILKKSLSLGVVGSAKDFYNWVIMDYELNSKKVPLIEENLIENILNDFLKQSFVTHGTFDPNEYIISENSPFYKKISSNDHYYIIGKANLSPIQYVRSRQISFLNQNNVSQDDIEEISIATTEAVENSVKYGDGEKVEISNFIENGKNFKLTMVNKIKEFDLQTEIDRGKYSSSITLMRGVLVMEKLFDKFDLILLDNNTQAMVQAEKKLK
ncbi:MAG: ATP-binding protein [Leptospiraceae bacterium]|nr:ATP-binding protein [Leptospiraceae bacterium]MCP5496010.1 ATP-binding protein [Leptospiraceae bacterium]